MERPCQPVRAGSAEPSCQQLTNASCGQIVDGRYVWQAAQLRGAVADPDGVTLQPLSDVGINRRRRVEGSAGDVAGDAFDP